MKRKIISGIYCIECKINNKKYIGYSNNLHRRFCEHKNKLRRNIHKNSYLQNSYDKYGLENFDFYIIQELVDEIKILKLMETYWIIYYNSHIDDGGGYNLSYGGEGYFPSKTTLQKLSFTSSGSCNGNYGGGKMSNESRKRISNARKGTHHTEETKEKMSKSHKGISTNLGEKLTERHKEKIRVGGRYNKRKNSISQYFGVTMNRRKTKWIAYFYENIKKTKPKIIGYFENEIDAALAYNEKIIELCENEAKLNIIENKGDLR